MIHSLTCWCLSGSVGDDAVGLLTPEACLADVKCLLSIMDTHQMALQKFYEVCCASLARPSLLCLWLLSCHITCMHP